MTKRIFAIVLALVMSLSMFAVEAFAAGATATLSGNNITITCTEAGAAKYAVDLFKDGSSYAGVKEFTGATLSATINNLPAGAYFAYVRPYDVNGNSLVTEAYKTNAVNITTAGGNNNTGVIYQAYFGPYLVTKLVDKATVSWNPVASAAQYRVTYSVNGVEKQAITGSPVVEIPAKVTDNFTVEVSAFSTTAALGSLGTQSIPAGTTGGSSTGAGGSGTTNTGNLSITKSTNSALVKWNAVPSATGYLVEYKKSTANAATSAFVTTNSTTVPCGVNDTWSVVVKALVNGQFVTVGSATVAAGYTGGSTGGSGIITSGNISVTKGTNSSVVKWNAVTGATGYIVYYKKTGETAANTVYAQTTQATIPCGSKDSWVVEVRAIINGSLTTVGSATVTPGSTTSGITTGTVTTAGMNCTVISTYSSSTITWNGTAASYMVIYTENGKGAKVQTVNTKSVTIPVGYNTSFSVIIVDTVSNATIATANVKASTTGGSSSTITKTDIKNLTLTYTSGWNTTVTWDKVDGAQFYQVDHALLGANAGETEVNTKNTITLPYGKNINFQVIVTAFMKDGTKKTVGYAYHVAGSTPSTDKDDDIVVDNDTDVTVTEDTVTGFWAETLGKGVVKLTWNEVEDCDTYKVYYRKVGATKWSGGHSRTKTFLSIDFGSKTSTYEFKIVAGDEESTILTLKPSAAKGTVAWAMNPESDAKYETNLAGVVKDADDGKITLSWEEVDGAKYKVYYRKAGTTTWKGGYDRTGESITITFKASNIDDAYEIMIKAGSKESDVFTIKPSVWTNAD